MPKDELMGKKTSLVDQGAFAGTLGTKEFMTFERRGRQLRKSTSMLLSHVRRKLEREELNLSTTVKDNKKCFYTYVNNKKRAKENLHPLLGSKGECYQR